MGGAIDDGGSDDAGFGWVAASEVVGCGGEALARWNVALRPEIASGWVVVVGVEGVDGGVGGGGEDEVVDGAVGHPEAADIKGLGEEVAVDWVGVELAEGRGVDVGGGQGGLVSLDTGAADVVVVGEDVAGVKDGERIRCWGGRERGLEGRCGGGLLENARGIGGGSERDVQRGLDSVGWRFAGEGGRVEEVRAGRAAGG